jgi:hypothetical protein
MKYPPDVRGNLMTRLGEYELYIQPGRGSYDTVCRAHDTVLSMERGVPQDCSMVWWVYGD